MKKANPIITFLLFVFFASSTFAQGYMNNGATTTVSPGTFLVINGSFVNNTNISSGSVNLDGTIKVNGNWINNASAGGILTSIDNNGTVLFNGNTTFSGTSSAPFDFENIMVASSSSVTINANIPITANANIINNGTINIKSTALGDGSLLVNGTVSGSGVFLVDRYLSASKWHLVSSPITNGLSGVFQNIWLRAYNEASNTFGSYITSSNTPLPIGQGFSVWSNSANEIRTFSGTINNGSVTPTVQLTGAASANTGWNLIGNPYPSAIDWDAASGWTKTNIANSIYVWNNNQYATYINGIGTNGGSRYIAMEQGFFVQTTAPSAIISMNNNVRVHNSTDYLKNNEGDPSNTIRIKVFTEEYSDEMVIAYRSEASDNFDYNFDAYKIKGSTLAPQFYFMKNEKMVAISSFNDVSKIHGQYLYFEPASPDEHYILYTHTLEDGNVPILYDQILHQCVYPNNPYLFKPYFGDPVTRFRFLEETNTSLEDTDNLSVNVYESNNTLYIYNLKDEKLIAVNVFDIQGRLVFEGNQAITDLNHLSKAIYIVNVVTDKEKISKKIIIKP